MSRKRCVKCAILNFFVAQQSVCCGFMRRSVIRVNKSCKVIIVADSYHIKLLNLISTVITQSQNAIGYKYVALDADLET